MKKRLFCLLLFSAFLTPISVPVLAQTLSIDQLHKMLEQSVIYQQKELETQIAMGSYRELRQERLPIFYLDANLQRNLIIPSTPVPAIAFDPTAPDGAIIPLKFATKWSSKAGIQLEWKLFDPQRRAAEKEQLLNVEKSEIQQQEAAQQWKRDATLAYAAIVLATKQYELALQDSVVYAEIVEISRARFEEGRVGRTDLNAAIQALERSKIQVYEAWSVLLDADLELRNYVDLGETETLETDIPGIIAYIEPQKDTNFDLQLLEIDQRLTILQEQGLRRQLLPSLSVNAYLGEQYFSNELKLAQRDQWFGNSFINLALRVPLSAYLTFQPTLRKLSNQHTLNAKRIEQVQRAYRIQKEQSSHKISAAKKKIEALTAIETLSKQSRDNQYASFLAGRMLLSEYNESVAAHLQAQQELWQAEFDLIDLLFN